jgi:hypothetical protein
MSPSRSTPDALLALRHGDAPSYLYRLDKVRDKFTSGRVQHGRSLGAELPDGHVLRSLPCEAIPDDWMQLAGGLAQSTVCLSTYTSPTKWERSARSAG